MKNSICLVFIALFGSFFLVSDLQAQNASPKREVGLQFSSLDLNGSSFSAFYKKEKKENVYRRIRFATGRIQLDLLEEQTNFDFNVGMAIGREKRKSLDDKLVFYHGPEFAASVSIFTSEVDDDVTPILVSPSFGWVFGLQHSFNDRWAINIETIPSFRASFNYYGGDGIGSAEGLFFGVGGSNTVSLSVLRKF
ncbi:MAG TPA: hypothetical protein VK168_02665 [Saprospiraceae bacterium]|nr:hypothetical protein [Saprospiraceae bacterium]